MSFSTFVFLIGLEKVGTSWIFGKGGVLEKGGGGGGRTPLTNYGTISSY